MDRENDIREIAYQLWEQDGRADGRALDYWLTAEALWTRQHQAAEARVQAVSTPPTRAEGRSRIQPRRARGKHR